MLFYNNNKGFFSNMAINSVTITSESVFYSCSITFIVFGSHSYTRPGPKTLHISPKCFKSYFKIIVFFLSLTRGNPSARVLASRTCKPYTDLENPGVNTIILVDCLHVRTARMSWGSLRSDCAHNWRGGGGTLITE